MLTVLIKDIIPKALTKITPLVQSSSMPVFNIKKHSGSLCLATASCPIQSQSGLCLNQLAHSNGSIQPSAERFPSGELEEALPLHLRWETLTPSLSREPACVRLGCVGAEPGQASDVQPEQASARS